MGKEKAGYSYPNMETTTYNMSVSKIWNDNLYDDNRFKSVIFNIYEDYDETPGAVNEPYATVTLEVRSLSTPDTDTAYSRSATSTSPMFSTI